MAISGYFCSYERVYNLFFGGLQQHVLHRQELLPNVFNNRFVVATKNEGPF